MNDQDLLNRYVDNSSGEAFAVLVSRHLDLVYSAAKRQVGSSDLATDVTQAVFTDLSRKAEKLRNVSSLPAWLYVVTRRTAIDLVRKERRRISRETIAAEIGTMDSSPSKWSQIEPCLDEAMASLGEKDRQLILMRFFGGSSLRDVGLAYGLSEDAAQKRVTRVLERLRTFLMRQGIVVTAAGFATDVSAHAVEAAPGGLGAHIISVMTSSKLPLSAAAAIETTKGIVMTSSQKLTVTATIVAIVGGGVFQQHVIRQQALELAANRSETSALRKELSATHVSPTSVARPTPAPSLRSTVDAKADPMGRLYMLQDLHKRNLWNGRLGLIGPKGKITQSFSELFALTSNEQHEIQGAIDKARRQLGDLSVANATLHDNGDRSVTINVKAYEGGALIEDGVMNAFTSTLGPDRFAAFTSLGADEVQEALGNYGAQNETLTITNASPTAGSGPPLFDVVDSRTTPSEGGNNTVQYRYAFANLYEVSARFGPVVNLAAEKFQ